jgi:hypothetical protein
LEEGECDFQSCHIIRYKQTKISQGIQKQRKSWQVKGKTALRETVSEKDMTTDLLDKDYKIF